jgi:hypothetical protein
MGSAADAEQVRKHDSNSHLVLHTDSKLSRLPRCSRQDATRTTGRPEAIRVLKTFGIADGDAARTRRHGNTI